MSNPIVCLMGPTASGKTALACALAEHYPFEIISVDSALIYRGMDIGTAKPDTQTLAKSPHHLIDILNPTEAYSAACFCEDVNQLVQAIDARGNTPLLVGGTMMYFRALQQGLSTLPAANESIRQQLLEQAKKSGWGHLHDELTRVDPVSAGRIHPHDTQRIQRALEVYLLTRQPLSSFEQPVVSFAGRFVNWILVPQDRAWLHQRIAQRFDEMLAQGFLDEVTQLVAKWQLTEQHPAMRSVGYRQALAYLAGALEYDEFHAKGIAATRQLAKRQLTWLRHWPDGKVIEADDPAVLSYILHEAAQLF